jgi:hypothetical protein
MSSLEHHLTELYVLIDDFLTDHPKLAHWRQSPHNQPAFTDAEVLTIALLSGCLGVASFKQTYRLAAHHDRCAFPSLCSYPPWIARLQALTALIGALLSTTMQRPSGSAAFYLVDAKPLPVCHRPLGIVGDADVLFRKIDILLFFGSIVLSALRHGLVLFV